MGGERSDTVARRRRRHCLTHSTSCGMTKTRRVQHFKAMFIGPCVGLGLQWGERARNAPIRPHLHKLKPVTRLHHSRRPAVPKVLRPLSALPGVLCHSESSVKVACRNVKHSSRRLSTGSGRHSIYNVYQEGRGGVIALLWLARSPLASRLMRRCGASRSATF